jgi:uncharacterized protein (DUF885 family)
MTEAKRFDALEKEFFNAWLSRNPVLAGRLGLHKYDMAMPEGTLSAELEDHRVLKRYLGKFKAIDGSKLPPARALDRDLLIQVLSLRLFEREELRFWESIPEAPAMIGAAYFLLLVSEHTSLANRLRAITVRMEKTPRYIEASRAKLTRPVKIWIDTELETLARLPSFFDALKQAGRINLLVREYDRLCRAIDVLQSTLEDYANWIIIDVLPRCRKEFAPGPEKFARLLALRSLGASPEEVLTFGWRQYKWHEMALRRLARKVQRGASVDEIREKVRASHPSTFADVLNAVRDSVKRAREVIARSGFATLPPDEELRVVETPVFLRHRMPFGGYYAPPRFESKQIGFYFVTPGEVERDLLKEHNVAALANMSVHEAYPGHHLHFVSANRHPSLARVFADGVETVEGWAHYCEEEMKRLGFDTSMESRFAQMQDMLWRAARVILDVRLATGKMEAEEAIRFLMEATGMERPAATAEVRRYTQTPGVPLSYLWGKERLKDLKQQCRRRMGRHFSERFFHDAILGTGLLPLHLLEREMEWRMAEEIQRQKTLPPPPEKGAKEKKAAAGKGAGVSPVPQKGGTSAGAGAGGEAPARSPVKAAPAGAAPSTPLPAAAKPKSSLAAPPPAAKKQNVQAKAAPPRRPPPRPARKPSKAAKPHKRPSRPKPRRPAAASHASRRRLSRRSR